jgi:hypothetical protein
MGISMCRADFRADHEKTLVFPPADIGGLQRLGEAGPPGTRIVLVERAEQGLAGHDVHINSGRVIVPVLVVKRLLGGGVLRDVVLQPGELMS